MTGIFRVYDDPERIHMIAEGVLENSAVAARSDPFAHKGASELLSITVDCTSQLTATEMRDMLNPEVSDGILGLGVLAAEFNGRKGEVARKVVPFEAAEEREYTRTVRRPLRTAQILLDIGPGGLSGFGEDTLPLARKLVGNNGVCMNQFFESMAQNPQNDSPGIRRVQRRLGYYEGRLLEATKLLSVDE